MGPTDPVSDHGVVEHDQAEAAAARADLVTVARGGTLNFAGAVSNAVLGFALVLVVTRGFGASPSGIFFESVALLSLLTTVAQWGSEVGVVRQVSSFRVLGRTGDIRHSIRSGIVPVAVAGVVIAAGLFAFADPLGDMLTNGQHGAELAPILRMLAPFLPVAAVFTVAIAATRGFGTMMPSVTIDKVGRPAGQLALGLLVVWAGWSTRAMALAWVLPIAVALALTIAWMRHLLRSWEREPGPVDEQLQGSRHTFREFWRFAAPRGLAGVFAVSILWLDVLLLGALRSPAEAGVYAASTRYLTVGQFVGIAVLEVVGPRLGALLATRNRSRARGVLGASTMWLMLAAWPLYLTMLVMGPVLLSVFGDRYQAATHALMILGGAMLVATAVGPVDMVLLMAGKSSWNLANTVVAVAANISLNLLLIPRFGLAGAATAWAVSIGINNLLPLGQVWRLTGIHPFGRGWLTAAAIPLVTFGGVQILVRWWLGVGPGQLVLALLIGGALWAVAIARFRVPLQISAFSEALRSRRRRG